MPIDPGPDTEPVPPGAEADDRPPQIPPLPPFPEDLDPIPRYTQADLNALRQAIQQSHLSQLAFYFLDYILRSQNALFEQIHGQRQLPRIIPAMMLLCVALSGSYGIVMGSYKGPLQALASGLKLPILFLLTALICVPSLYTFNVMLGQRFRFLQTFALMVTTLASTALPDPWLKLYKEIQFSFAEFAESLAASRHWLILSLPYHPRS